MTELAVAIVNYNTREHLRACLATVLAEGASEVVVVDNASTDGSVEMVRAEYPQVVVIANTHNPGYGGGANQAIRSCQAPAVLLLNSDTRLQPGALQGLATALDQHPEAAIVGPKLINPDGSLQASCYPFPTPLYLFLEESALWRLVGQLPGVRDRYLRTWTHDAPKDVPWVLGAALAIRRAPFEQVGGFDESFFMYSEEVDLCYRLHQVGWQVHFTPLATIMHIGGASTSQKRAQMVPYVFASAAHFYRRHYSAGQMLGLRLVVAILMVAKIARDGLALRRAADPQQRDQLRENVRVWRHILGDSRQRWVTYG